jgi:hypothetical protein
VNPLNALALAISVSAIVSTESAILVPDAVNTLRSALAASLFGCFAALLVVGYQIARARPAVR